MKIFKFINKKKENLILLLLFIFSIYSALTIGQSYDEDFHLLQGKVTLNYLLSFGRIDQAILYRENYSSIYWAIQFFLTTIFPLKYQIEIAHLINLFFGISTIYGIGKISRKLFNKQVGKIVFLILFFYPVFFGHMAFNSKDTILAFCHVWITYLVFSYFQKQNKSDSKITFLIAVLAALGTGIQLVFLGSLLPLFFFLLIEIFIIKKLINKTFDKIKFLKDFIKCFFIFYLLLILFWIDTHQNIFVLPYKIFLDTLSPTYWTGWPYNLLNGIFYNSSSVPKTYFLISFIYKSPEYILFLYAIFFPLIFKNKIFFSNNFKLFYYKLLIIIFFIAFPNLILFIMPYPIYDGLRLFLWTLPYFCIIPALSIYYIILNLKFLISKIVLGFSLSFFLFFLFNFINITPYHYTYLNSFNGKNELRNSRFENDYWGSSIKELIKSSNFNNNKSIIFATCGVNPSTVKKYLKKKGYNNFSFGSFENADYIIMTNRVTYVIDEETDTKKLTSCFKKHKGTDTYSVVKNGLTLSLIRKLAL